jgi:ribosomal protein L33
VYRGGRQCKKKVMDQKFDRQLNKKVMDQKFDRQLNKKVMDQKFDRQNVSGFIKLPIVFSCICAIL